MSEKLSLDWKPTQDVAWLFRYKGRFYAPLEVIQSGDFPLKMILRASLIILGQAFAAAVEEVIMNGSTAHAD